MVSKLVKWRDDAAEANGPRAADEQIKVVQQMCAWGLLRGLLLCNPAAPVPRIYKGGNREEIIWTPEDCAAWDATPKIPRYMVDVRRLVEFTGLRRADLIALTWDEISDTHIARTASKKSRGKRRRTVMPIVPGLKALLEELKTRPRTPGVETVLVNAHGNPIAGPSLTTNFIKWRAEAKNKQGIWHRGTYDDEPDRAKTLHDLRGTFATKLMTLPGGSLTDDQIATIMGWSVKQVAAIRKVYVDEAAIVVAIGRRIADALENEVENDTGSTTLSG
ncbi:tyrosine-type recombinase/integrase [Novosphingobium sp. PS1R-30]|uniref:Tyrosine-type recombinase/integrase n=1 Tax=Novosphingobium anseongense TaxID=3133436 RepID=A0ABU8RVF1_9SPHN